MTPRSLPSTRPALAAAGAALGLLATLACLSLPVPVRAETINCTPITSLPAVISTQGVYCLRQDLATAVNSGSVISIATNNVTLDCNGYKVGGLAAGPDSQAVGIQASVRQNITVRNCGVRGFRTGISLSGGTGHLVEDNRVDSSLLFGIFASGEGTVIRRNRVYDTGSDTLLDAPAGILANGSVDVLDNIVTGVSASPSWGGRAIGIWAYQNELGTLEGNRVRDIWAATPGKATALYFSGFGGAIVTGNRLANVGGVGAECGSNSTAISQNHFVGFTSAIVLCANGGGNVLHQP